MPCKGFAVGEALYFPPPYVINNTAQWILFVNKINANDSNFLSKSFVLGADLDFANNAISPVGSNSNGFQGVLYGNKHTIKRANINAVNDPSSSSYGIAGLFARINGGSIYDLQIANTCTYSYALGKHTYVGTLTAYAKNATITNVTSYANITVNNTSAANASQKIAAGGLVGVCESGYLRIYKSAYSGIITETAFNNSNFSSAANASICLGGLCGNFVNSGNIEFTVNACAIKVKFTCHSGGLHVGSLLGGSFGRSDTPSRKLNLSNITINVDGTSDGVLESPNIHGLIGPYMENVASGSVCKNIYLGATAAYNSMSTWNNCRILIFSESLGYVSPTNISYSNIYRNYNESGVTTNYVSSQTAALTPAASNTELTNVFNINSSTGAATDKLNTTGNIAQRACY